MYNKISALFNNRYECRAFLEGIKYDFYKQTRT